MPLSDPSPARWYLIQCKPGQDERAREHLERQGYECYRPTRIVERRRQGRRQRVAESLLPGYFFIHLDRIHDRWHPIRSTRGVSCVVCFSGEPTPVADEIIEGIRARLALADRVSIPQDAFTEIEALFVSTDGVERVSHLLNILQHDQIQNIRG